MKNRNVFVSLFLLAAIFLVFIIRRWNEPLRKEAFDRKPAVLSYSDYALCRMDCLQITKEEVQEIMGKGIINFNESNRRSRPCPTFALQGSTTNGEKIRVIFVQCPTETKVLSCYNLKEKSECHCPVDEKKKND